MNQKRVKKVAALQLLLFVLTIVLSQIPVSVSAAGSLAVDVSDSFRNSVFFQRACEAYDSTQNPIDRFVRIALSQKGYVGGSARGQWAGAGPNGRHTEYGRFMGKDGLDWCASFVSWCAAAAGIPTSVIPRSAGAGEWKFVNTGTYTKLWANNFKTYIDYKPQVGDLALYMPYHDKEGCYKHYNADAPTAHVVIVASVSNSKNADGSWTFTTIERGNNNTVEQKTLTTKTTRGKGGTCACGLQPAGTYSYVVQGFFRPNLSPASGDSWQVNPGNTNNGPDVRFSLATDPTYKGKEFLSETNAVVVNQVVKPAGTAVTAMGLYLYDRHGNLIKRHQESISNVRAAGTTYHGWYDINGELNVTLKPATTYQYKFFGVFNGYEVVGPAFTFTTKGTNTVRFDSNGGSAVNSVSVAGASKIGTLPTPQRDGYSFQGWYTQASGGNIVDSSTIIYDPTTLYAHWIYIHPENDPEEEKPFLVRFTIDGEVVDAKFVNDGEAYGDLPDITLYNATFEGWFTNKTGGEQIFPDTIAYLDGPTTLYGHYTVNTDKDSSDNDRYDDDYDDSYNDNYEDNFEDEDVFIEDTDDTDQDSPENTIEGSTVIVMQIGNPYFTKNGKRFSIDDNGTVPIVRSGRTLVPVRALVESLGGTVEWNDTLQGVTMTLDGTVLDMRINKTKAYVNYKSTLLDVAPILYNSRTLLPIRFIAENFGAVVTWDEETQSIYIAR